MKKIHARGYQRVAPENQQVSNAVAWWVIVEDDYGLLADTGYMPTARLARRAIDAALDRLAARIERRADVPQARMVNGDIYHLPDAAILAERLTR